MYVLCRLAGFVGLVFLLLASVLPRASNAADPLHIVAFGDSQTYGRMVYRNEAYPAKLEAALKAKVYDATVANEGLNGDTSTGALGRLDSAVPAGTQIAIVEFGLNDGGKGLLPNMTRENIVTMVHRLRDRNVQVLVYDATARPDIDVSAAVTALDALYFRQPSAPPGDRADLKSFHLNAAGYDWLVAQLMPSVETLIDRVEHPNN
jgi:acyl-CoA thioesterase I